MGSKVVFKPNSAGFAELFTSQEMQEYLESVAEDIAAKASEMSGETYGAGSKTLDKTAVAYASARGYDARKDALENHTLQKAIGAAGLPTKKPEGDGISKRIKEAIEDSL